MEGGSGGFAEGKARSAEFGLIGLDDSAGIVEAVVGSGEFDGVGGETVDAVVLGSTGDFVLEVADFEDQGEFFGVLEEV